MDRGAILNIVEKISEIQNSDMKISEADTIRVLIMPMLQALGWDITDLSEVRSEFRKIQGDNPVDCALFINGVAQLFIEAKSLQISVDDRKWATQALNYANTCGVRWCVLTNGEVWNFYKVHLVTGVEDKIFFTIDFSQKDEWQKNLEALSWISRENVIQNKISKAWEEIYVTKKVRDILFSLHEHEGILKAFSSQINDENIRYTDVKSVFEKLDFTSLKFDRLFDNSECEDSSEKDKRLPRFSQLFREGLLKKGDVLKMKSRPNVTAIMDVDDKVIYEGESLSFSAWGRKVYNAPSFNPANNIETESGISLGELRDAMISG